MRSHTSIAWHRTRRADLLPAFVKLLRDQEAEVRIAAAGKVAAFSKKLTPQLIISEVGRGWRGKGLRGGADRLPRAGGVAGLATRPARPLLRPHDGRLAARLA
jgi:hypothetical protein